MHLQTINVQKTKHSTMCYPPKHPHNYHFPQSRHGNLLEVLSTVKLMGTSLTNELCEEVEKNHLVLSIHQPKCTILSYHLFQDVLRHE